MSTRKRVDLQYDSEGSNGHKALVLKSSMKRTVFNISVLLCEAGRIHYTDVNLRNLIIFGNMQNISKSLI